MSWGARIAVISLAVNILAFPHAAQAGEACAALGKFTLPLVLSYEDLVDKTTNAQVTNEIPYESFIEHVDLLTKAGYSFVTTRDYLAALEGKREWPEKPVLLTFDIGFASHYRAFEELKRRKLKATFFVSPGWVGGHTAQKKFLNWMQVRAIHAHPDFVVESYTKERPDLKMLSETVLRKELGGAIASLARALPKIKTAKVNKEAAGLFLAYPEGSYDPIVARVAQDFHPLAFTRGTDPLANPDYDAAISKCFQMPRLAMTYTFARADRLLKALDRFRTQLAVYAPLKTRSPASEEAQRQRPLRTFHRRDY